MSKGWGIPSEVSDAVTMVRRCTVVSFGACSAFQSVSPPLGFHIDCGMGMVGSIECAHVGDRQRIVIRTRRL